MPFLQTMLAASSGLITVVAEVNEIILQLSGNLLGVKYVGIRRQPPSRAEQSKVLKKEESLGENKSCVANAQH